MPTLTVAKWWQIFRLTSVGHENFESYILQQVSSGKHSSDLTEHPFAMQTLWVGQYLMTADGH